MSLKDDEEIQLMHSRAITFTFAWVSKVMVTLLKGNTFAYDGVIGSF